MRLLDAFAALFDGKPYRHRVSNQSDSVSLELYEDLVALGYAPKLSASIAATRRGVGPGNKAVTLARTRRGDGTLGLLVNPSEAFAVTGYSVVRGAIATIECAVEMKILNKAMLKQIDRVMNDLEKQVGSWRSFAPQAITVAIVGINHAPFASSFEGERETRTDGRKHKHPIDEAPEAESRIRSRIVERRIYDEVLILRYKATNIPPYPFSWVDHQATLRDYRALLIRLSGRLETML